MRHLITTLLTTALVLMTSVVFSQEEFSILHPEEKCATITQNSTELTRSMVESSFRIKHRVEKRKEKVAALKEDEKNLPNFQKSNYQAMLDVIYDPVCIPVVFNIIHDGDPYGSQFNPADEDLLALLNMLNDQFSSYISADPNIPAQLETGFTFVWGGSDGTNATAIRRFDRTDPANEYIVYGNPNTPDDDWPAEQQCGVPQSAGNLTSFSGLYQARVAYEPTNNLNVYLIKTSMPALGWTWPANSTGLWPAQGTWEGNFPPFNQWGIFLNSGRDLCTGSSAPALPNGFSYDELSDIYGTSDGDDFKYLISHQAGHYLGLLHTFQEPDPLVLDNIMNGSYGGMFDNGCSVMPTDWTRIIEAAGFDDILPPGFAPISQCYIHGDGCCDTKWSSSYFHPLVLSSSQSDNCAHLDPSALVSGNNFANECEASTMGVHLENESHNRINVMNYNWGGDACPVYLFTQDQINRMHDQTLFYRQDLIAQGALACLNPDLDTIYGCTDPIACNYQDDANTYDGSCFYDCCPECIYDYDGDGWITLNDMLWMLVFYGNDCPE